ncbi:MAG: DNA-binding GntR family transcriptional regulator [Candidatus Paceibacteria bacterium]
MLASDGADVNAPERQRGARADEISKQIADDIVLGRFEPGARLDEAMLAGLFGVSRTPVREALKQLAIQGLVVSRPNRGSVVAELTPEQRDRMFEAIGELEAACARYAAIRMSAAEREHLSALHAQSRDAMRAGDVDLYDRLNHAWHQVIIRGCGNPVLIEMTLGLRHRIAPFRRSQFRNVERMSASYEEHAVIIEALLAHDVTTAQRQMRAHLVSARSATARVAGSDTGKIPPT